jgi:RNA polymerase sigma-70 factor (ECF subfamily)
MDSFENHLRLYYFLVLSRQREPSVSTPVDPQPPEELFRRHSSELLRFFTRQTRCSELAADLRQETWLRLQGRPAGEIGNVRAFLYRIARNLLIDHHRQQRIRPQLAPLDETLESELPDPERATEESRRLASLQTLMHELPEHLRQALLWNRLDGLTQREIGERLGVSESMAGRYILKALEYCQERMDDL